VGDMWRLDVYFAFDSDNSNGEKEWILILFVGIALHLLVLEALNSRLSYRHDAKRSHAGNIRSRVIEINATRFCLSLEALLSPQNHDKGLGSMALSWIATTTTPRPAYHAKSPVALSSPA